MNKPAFTPGPWRINKLLPRTLSEQGVMRKIYRLESVKDLIQACNKARAEGDDTPVVADYAGLFCADGYVFLDDDDDFEFNMPISKFLSELGKHLGINRALEVAAKKGSGDHS